MHVFLLTKFVSNTTKSLKLLPSFKISSKFVSLDLGSDNGERTVGSIYGLLTPINYDLNQLPKIFPRQKKVS